jgi:hypothetical protein
MFVKITIAIAFILGTASGALAAPKQKHNASRSYVYDTHGQHGVSASRAKTTHAKTTKTTRAKTTHVKTAQKRRTIEAYASYESRNWFFGGATSALARANPKQSSNRHHELYNTRAQYTGPASRAAATPRHGHSSNPAYDVYDTRGWYIGSDPDETIRSMMAMDPASVD